MLNGNSVNINGNENVSSTLPGTPLTRKKSKIPDYFSTSNRADLLGWFAVGGLKMDLNNSHSIHPSILFLFHSAGVHFIVLSGQVLELYFPISSFAYQSVILSLSSFMSE